VNKNQGRRLTGVSPQSFSTDSKGWARGWRPTAKRSMVKSDGFDSLSLFFRWLSFSLWVGPIYFSILFNISARDLMKSGSRVWDGALPAGVEGTTGIRKIIKNLHSIRSKFSDPKN
jgi:hypothetical protein